MNTLSALEGYPGIVGESGYSFTGCSSRGLSVTDDSAFTAQPNAGETCPKRAEQECSQQAQHDS